MRIVMSGDICVARRLRSWPPSPRMAREFRRRAVSAGGSGVSLRPARTLGDCRPRIGERLGHGTVLALD